MNWILVKGLLLYSNLTYGEGFILTVEGSYIFNGLIKWGYNTWDGLMWGYYKFLDCVCSLIGD